MEQFMLPGTHGTTILSTYRIARQARLLNAKLQSLVAYMVGGLPVDGIRASRND